MDRFDDMRGKSGKGKYQEKSVLPSAVGTIVHPDEGYDALSNVSVLGDDNLTGENIKAGVNIFGIDGVYGGGSGATIAGKKVSVEATEDISKDKAFVGVRNANFKKQVTKSTFGPTFILLSRDGRVGITAQTLNQNTNSFMIYFRNENGLFDAVSFPVTVSLQYPTMSSTTCKINQDGTIALVSNYSNSSTTAMLLINIDPDTRTASLTELTDWKRSDLDGVAKEVYNSGYNYYTYYYANGIAKYDYFNNSSIAGNELVMRQEINVRLEYSNSDSTSDSTLYVLARYKIYDGRITLVKEVVSDSDAPTPICWINSTYYYRFRAGGLNDTVCYVDKYRKSSGGDELVGTVTLSLGFVSNYYKSGNFSENGEYVVAICQQNKSSYAQTYHYIYRINKETMSITKVAENNEYPAKVSAAINNDGTLLNTNGKIKEYVNGSWVAIVSSGASLPSNGVFEPDSWLTTTQVQHLAPIDDSVEYYIAPMYGHTVQEGKGYGVTTEDLLAGEQGHAQLLVELYADTVSLQTKTVTPTTETQEIVPDSTYTGLKQVTVEGDEDLKPENIKFGVTIFGVEGTLTNTGGGGDDPTETYEQIVNYQMLYDYGDECTALTGGYKNNTGSNSYTKAETLTKNENNIYMARSSSSGGMVHYQSTNTVDITGYSGVFVVFEAYNASGINSTGSFAGVKFTQSGSNSNGVAYNTQVTYAGENSGTTGAYTYAKGMRVTTGVSYSGSVYVCPSLCDPGSNFTHNLYATGFLKEDDWLTLAQKANVMADSMDSLLNQSEALLSNANAVEFMIKQCTGTFMARAVTSSTFKSALASSSYYSTVTGNPHWYKFLSMAT